MKELIKRTHVDPIKPLGDKEWSGNFGIFTKPVLTHPGSSQRHKSRISLHNFPLALHAAALSVAMPSLP